VLGPGVFLLRTGEIVGQYARMPAIAADLLGQRQRLVGTTLLVSYCAPSRRSPPFRW